MAREKQHSARLTDDDVSFLRSLPRKRSTSDTVANRCRILLDLDEAHPPVLTHADCARSHGISAGTVANTARTFGDGGMGSVITLKRSANSDNARRNAAGDARQPGDHTQDAKKTRCAPIAPTTGASRRGRTQMRPFRA